jgi:hypothetical protein
MNKKRYECKQATPKKTNFHNVTFFLVSLAFVDNLDIILHFFLFVFNYLDIVFNLKQ